MLREYQANFMATNNLVTETSTMLKNVTADSIYTGDLGSGTVDVQRTLTCNTLFASQVVTDRVTVTGTGYALQTSAGTSKDNLSFAYNDTLRTVSMGIDGTTSMAMDNRMYQVINPTGITDPQNSGFVALANQSAPQTSFQNGAKAVSYWNQTQAVQNTSGWRDVEYASELNLFVAVSGATTIPDVPPNPNFVLPVGATNIQYSSDGLQWTNVTFAGPGTPSEIQWFAVKWAPEIGVFLAMAKVVKNTTTSHFAYSTDGKTFTMLPRTDAVDGTGSTFETQNTWAGLAWSPVLRVFSAVSNNNLSMLIMYDATASPPVLFSEPMPILSLYPTDYTDPDALVPQFDSLVWAPEIGKFVAPLYVYGKQGVTDPLLFPPGDLVVFSTTGESYTSQRLPDTLKGAWKTITWSPQLGLLVCVSERVPGAPLDTTGSAIMTAFDVQVQPMVNQPDVTVETSTWRGVPYAQTQGADQRYRCITWAPEYGMFVSVGYSTTTSNKLLYSFDGVTWILKDFASLGGVNLGAYQVRNIAYSRELSAFVLVADGPYTGAPPVPLPGYIFDSSNVFKLPAPNNVFNACYNKTDENGSWGFGASGADPMPEPTKGFLCCPAGALAAPLATPPTLGNGLNTGYAPMFFDVNTGTLYVWNFKTSAWKAFV